MFSNLTDSVVQSLHQSSRGSNPIERIVIHTMEAPEEADTAEKVANYFRSNDRQVSAHYCVDNNSIVGCVPEERIANHATGDNSQSIGIELAGKAAQTKEQWDDVYSRAELVHAAKLAADIAKRQNIPVRLLTADELAARKRGFVSHKLVSDVFGASIRTDPGANFPWNGFLEDVEAFMDGRKWQVRLFNENNEVLDRSAIVRSENISVVWKSFTARIADRVGRMARRGDGPRVRVVRVAE